MILAGGAGSADNTFLDDIWAWDGTRWNHAITSGTGPTGRMGGTLVADVAGRSLLYFGGSETGGRPAQQLWRLDRDNHWFLVSSR